MSSSTELANKFIDFLTRNEARFQSLNETLIQFDIQLMDQIVEDLKAEGAGEGLESLECAFLATPLDETRGLIVMDAKLPFKAPDERLAEVARLISLLNTRLLWTFLVFHEPENVATCRINSHARASENLDDLAEEMIGAISSTAMLAIPTLLNVMQNKLGPEEAIARLDQQLENIHPGNE